MNLRRNNCWEMDGKLFNLIEIIVIGGLLIAVLYLGGLFADAPKPAPEPVPSGTPVRVLPTVATAQAPVPTPTPRPTRTPAPTSKPSTYQIISGDTCTSIAVRFDISLESLIIANNLDSECRIFAGDSLKIPAPTPTIAP
ncbi:MAG TPA: LysM peptidoglycan-binding domain-containing protein [Anaerolineales bacterium]|nr:LysM peptidoglycan-binding domain-containing protein [Anaerolineales bacterium]